MILTNDALDNADALAEADTFFAILHGASNDPTIVAKRYADLHMSWGHPVPVRTGASILPSSQLLFPASRRSQCPGACDAPRSAWPNNGVVATLRDETTGVLGDFYIEMNGRFGVEVTGRA